MKKLVLACLATALFATPALAEEPAPGDCAAMEGDAKAQCEAAKAAADKAVADAKKALEELGDCAAKEATEKAACETKKAELEAVITPAPDASKGGKATRGNTNRLETKFEDE